MLKLATLLFVFAVLVPALPFGSVVGHCGTTSISVTVDQPPAVGQVHCKDDLVAFWQWNVPFFAEIGSLQEDDLGLPMGSGDVALTLRAATVYRFRPDWTGFFAACFDVVSSTYGDGSASGSHSFGPWSAGTPCVLSQAIAVTRDDPILFIGRTFLHAERGAHVALVGNASLWDSNGQLITGAFELTPIAGLEAIPEPSAGLPIAVAILSAVTLRNRRKRPHNGMSASAARRE